MEKVKVACSNTPPKVRVGMARDLHKVSLIMKIDSMCNCSYISKYLGKDPIFKKPGVETDMHKIDLLTELNSTCTYIDLEEMIATIELHRKNSKK